MQKALAKTIVSYKKNKLILKTQQRFKSESYNASTAEVKKIRFSDDYDKECNQSVLQKHAHTEHVKINM